MPENVSCTVAASAAPPSSVVRAAARRRLPKRSIGTATSGKATTATAASVGFIQNALATRTKRVSGFWTAVTTPLIAYWRLLMSLPSRAVRSPEGVRWCHPTSSARSASNTRWRKSVTIRQEIERVRSPRDTFTAPLRA